MPVPQPGDEEEKEFISRCMGDENMQEYEQEQRAAICYKQWREPKTASIHDLHHIIIADMLATKTPQPG